MKTISVGEAEGQLARLISEANRGEIIVIRHGDEEATLCSASALDLEEDSPELEAELMKAAKGPFTPFKPEDLREACELVARAKRVG